MPSLAVLAADGEGLDLLLELCTPGRGWRGAELRVRTADAESRPALAIAHAGHAEATLGIRVLGAAEPGTDAEEDQNMPGDPFQLDMFLDFEKLEVSLLGRTRKFLEEVAWAQKMDYE